MATVESWFLKFAARHVERLPRPDWPPLDSAWWEAFKAALVRNGVTEDVATRASVELAESPPPHLDRQIEAFIARVRQIWAESRTQAPPPPAGPAPENYSSWDHEADAHWSYLTETERDEWRVLVRQRLPVLARHPCWLEGLAKGWAFDPTLVVGPPPSRSEPAPKTGEPRRMFS